LPINIILVRSS